MAQTLTDNGTYLIGVGNGTNDNDLLITTDEVSDFDCFQLVGSTGAVDVEVMLNVGGTFTTAAVALEDLGAAPAVSVLLTAPLRLYRFTGNFHQVRIRQNGATAANYVLRAYRRAS